MRKSSTEAEREVQKRRERTEAEREGHRRRENERGRERSIKAEKGG